MFSCFYLWLSCDESELFFLYQSMWEDTKSKSFVRFSHFHLLLNSSLKCETLKKKERKKRLVPLQICSPLHCWTTFCVCMFLYHRQPPEHIGVELGYVDTVWSFMCSPVQTPTSHDHMFYVCSPLHTLFYSYWTEIYYSSNTSTKNPRLVCMKKLFTEHVGPLFITTRDHFITSSTVTSGEEGTGFLFLFFCFFFIRLNPIFILRDFH